jgi:nicotinamide riboside transporter PnuC
MKENWFNSMFMEGGKVSHKRWIAVSISAILAWCIIFAIVKATGDKAREAVINSTMIFVLVMSGVATIAQITGLITRTPPKDEPKKDEPKKD